MFFLVKKFKKFAKLLTQNLVTALRETKVTELWVFGKIARIGGPPPDDQSSLILDFPSDITIFRVEFCGNYLE